jgi:hypothetical protein
MKYAFDLRDNWVGPSRPQFLFYPNAVAALELPEQLDDTFSLLVYGGIVVNPLQHPRLIELLPDGVRSRIPEPLYHSGWGVVTFHQVCGGKVIVRPFAPRLSPKHWEQLHDETGKPVSFHREWPTVDVAESMEHEFEFLLEQPWAYMWLSMRVAGPIHFAVNPSCCVPQSLVSPDTKGAYDLYRSDQLAELKSVLNCDV